MRIVIILAGLLLTGYAEAETPDDPPRGAYIEMSGGTYRFERSVRVYADDRIVTEAGSPLAPVPEEREQRQGAPGLFEEMTALVAARGAEATAAAHGHICPDYGFVAVRAVPAINGFSALSAGCPDPAVVGLSRSLRALIDGEE